MHVRFRQSRLQTRRKKDVYAYIHESNVWQNVETWQILLEEI